MSLLPRFIAVAGVLLGAASSAAVAAEFRSTADPATVLYDAPSTKSKGLYVLGRDTPLEVIVVLEGWIKVRDVGGSIGWMRRRASPSAGRWSSGCRSPRSARPPTMRRRSSSGRSSTSCSNRPRQATSTTTTATPGWIKVRHRDGQTGYVRVAQVFGI